MAQSYVAGAAVATTLSSNLNNSATSFAVVDASGWPGSVPFVIAIDRGTDNEEKILVTARSGTSITNCTRGYDSTSAVSHSVGTDNVEHVLSATQIQELIDHANSDSAHVSAAELATELSPYRLTADTIATAEIDDDAVTTAKIADGAVTSAQLDAAIPLGVLDYEQVVADQAGITALADLTGLSVTVTVGTDRRIRVRGVVRASNTGANSNVLYIREGATVLQTASYVGSTATESIPPAEAILTPTAGSHTYKLSAEAGAGTMTLRAASTAPAFIIVEDIGAA